MSIVRKFKQRNRVANSSFFFSSFASISEA